ncbi:HPr family phosphocarrier protein [Pseudomonas sp. MYb185]|uniref:HPr family phosphocarrier protein n=1 Tax=Pseudomonas sp. MYb185 TaxID=1848729 RepID=UPI000CFC2015|nr:HPr family phosphocarrier protein [Pseudomonas sp. MYb185]PRB80152.1 phosphocarrier protein HPr [Pseudomonas sp. MYb185]
MTQLTQRVQIINKLGLHARAAAKFVSVAKQHGCSVWVGGDEQRMVDGKSIMQVMMLAASKGTELCITCEGDHAEQAMDELVCLINDYFGEGE